MYSKVVGCGTMFTPGAERGGVGAPTPPPTTPASYSSASARVAAARRRSGLFTSGARQSPFATPGRSTPLNRSLQTSQLLESAGQYTMEFYGSSLPTLVKEALTFADQVKSSEDGNTEAGREFQSLVDSNA
ncbi:hypothetical protein E2C01_009727 [Portunus trituberculatus]|uniref:Uncharacterized protein n=1 Tax=Portunus trituberculatus TaxID=210409 RepID=A0A5B7D6I7_PORTR|nr:hypothetical protein [Portunus trituberculatus]